MDLKSKIAGLGTKTLAIIAVMIVAVSAATVAYLSTVATATANVQSPFEIKFTEVPTGMTISTDGLTATMGDVTGGSTYQLKAELWNNANNPVTAKTEINCQDATTTTCDVTIVHQNQLMVGGVWTDVGTPETVSCAGGKYVVQPGYAFPTGHHSRSVVDFTPASTYLGLLSCEVQALPA